MPVHDKNWSHLPTLKHQRHWPGQILSPPPSCFFVVGSSLSPFLIKCGKMMKLKPIRRLFIWMTTSYTYQNEPTEVCQLLMISIFSLAEYTGKCKIVPTPFVTFCYYLLLLKIDFVFLFCLFRAQDIFHSSLYIFLRKIIYSLYLSICLWQSRILNSPNICLQQSTIMNSLKICLWQRTTINCIAQWYWCCL